MLRIAFDAWIQYIVVPEALSELKSVLFSSVNQLSSRDICHENFHKKLSDVNEAERSSVNNNRLSFRYNDFLRIKAMYSSDWYKGQKVSV